MKITFHKFAVFLMILLHLCVSQGYHTSKKPSELMKPILVVSGYDDDYNEVSDAQVVTSNEPTKTCSLPNLTKALAEGTGGVVDKTIILCGGVIDGEGITSDCHIFDKESSFWYMTKMTIRRTGSASAPLNGALWVTGGWDEDGHDLSTSEMVYPDGTVRPGPPLPSAMVWHCMVTLHNQNIMLINYDGTVEVYNPVTKDFTSGPSTSYRYGRPACALFRSSAHENRPVVLCVDGAGKIAELLDHTKASEWEQIADLPTGMDWPTAITSADGKGVYVQNEDEFYELNCSTTCSWTTMSQTLPIAVDSAIMMYLPPELTCFP